MRFCERGSDDPEVQYFQSGIYQPCKYQKDNQAAEMLPGCCKPIVPNREQLRRQARHCCADIAPKLR